MTHTLGILQMSLQGSLFILAVLGLRRLTGKRLHSQTFLLLWDLCLLRLLLPFSLPSHGSVYSLLGGILSLGSLSQTEAAPTAAVSAQTVTPNLGTAVPGTLSAAETAVSGTSVSPWLLLWLLGALVCAAGLAAAYAQERRRLRCAEPLENPLLIRWLAQHSLRRSLRFVQSDRVSTPLTYGVLRPVILMPACTDWSDETLVNCVLAHELVHIRRFDSLCKLLASAALCLHWFNPLVWAMSACLNRDIELSCDQWVLRQMGGDARKKYAFALIHMEELRTNPLPFSNGFGQSAIEERIVSIMKYKKLTPLALLASILIVISCFVLFGTGPVANAAEEPEPEPIAETETIIEKDYETVQMTRYSDFTHFDINLSPDMDTLMGKELWQEGDVITFTLTSEEPVTVDVGILEASTPEVNDDYNSYEGFQSQTVTLSQEPTVVTVTIPRTALYGIGLEYHCDVDDCETDERILNDDWLTVSMDIDKTFENQLVSEENAH